MSDAVHGAVDEATCGCTADGRIIPTGGSGTALPKTPAGYYVILKTGEKFWVAAAYADSDTEWLYFYDAANSIATRFARDAVVMVAKPGVLSPG